VKYCKAAVSSATQNEPRNPQRPSQMSGANGTRTPDPTLPGPGNGGEHAT
jgi:hypothetical protein